MKYILFVDESGDQGLDKIRTASSGGSSPFMTLGAALVPISFIERFRARLEEISKAIKRKELHCVDLNHFQTAFFAREVSQLRLLSFGVISKKTTIGSYRSEIEGGKMAQDYYNKCCQYLLELVGAFMSESGIESDDLSIVFEKKNHNYQRLRNYISAIRANPIDARAKAMMLIDPLSVTARTKREEPLLALADLVAFSLFQSVNECDSNFGMPEQRYLREILCSFHRNPKDGQIANYGIKYIKGPVAMKLSGRDQKFALKQYRKTSM